MYLSIPFPECLALGAVRAPVFLTDVAETVSGYESRNANWTQVRHEFDVGFAIRTKTDYALLARHFYMAKGRLHSFGMLDFLDSEVSEDEGIVQEVNGEYQLFKRYGTGPEAYLRKITRPVTANVDGAGVTVDLDTGKVIPDDSSTDPTGYAWSGTFLVPARYAIDKLPSQVTTKRSDGEYMVEVTGVNIIEVRE